MSIEAHAMKAFDYSAVQLLARENPWHVIVKDQETANMPMAVEGDRQKPTDKKSAMKSGEGENASATTEAEDFPLLIDFEKICLWDHDGAVKVVGIRMEDPDYMKERLMEWVHAVAAYVRFLHASHADHIT